MQKRVWGNLMWELSTRLDNMRTFTNISYIKRARIFSKLSKLKSSSSPIGAIREATDLVKSAGADVLISIGGGSPIDSAKAIVYQIHEDTGKWIPSIAVPTTLSVAETTQNAGFTTEEKKKIAVSNPELVPKGINNLRHLD